MRLTRTAATLALVLLPTLAARALPGDVDADGAITLQDATLAARIAAEPLQHITPQWFAANVAGPLGPVQDNTVDWHDVVRITRVAAGFEEMPDAPPDRLGSVYASLTVSGDLTKDYEIPIVPGSSTSTWPVTGHLTNLTAGIADPRVLFYHFFDGGGASGQGTSPAEDGAYALHVPPDDYDVFFGGTVVEPTVGGSYTWEYRVDLKKHVVVTAPTTLDLDVASATPPIPGELAGAVPTTNIIPLFIRALSRADPYPAPIDITKTSLIAEGIISDTAYHLKATPARHAVFINAVHADDPALTYSLQFTGQPELKVGQVLLQDLLIPEAVPVSFEFQPPADTTIENLTLSTSLVASGLLLQATSKPGKDADTFESALPAGDVSVAVNVKPNDPAGVRRLFSVRRTVSVPSEGGSVGITLPPLPAVVTLRGTVTYPNGVPAAGIEMSLDTSGGGLPGASDYRLAARVTTDAEGNYAVQVPAGRYTVQVPA